MFTGIKIQKSIIAVKRITGDSSAMHTIIPVSGSSKDCLLLPGVPSFCKLEVKGREGPANIHIQYLDKAGSLTACYTLNQKWMLPD
jgi:hypothetical protein